jgi:hypothetical protein
VRRVRRCQLVSLIRVSRRLVVACCRQPDNPCLREMARTPLGLGFKVHELRGSAVKVLRG